MESESFSHDGWGMVFFISSFFCSLNIHLIRTASRPTEYSGNTESLLWYLYPFYLLSGLSSTLNRLHVWGFLVWSGICPGVLWWTFPVGSNREWFNSGGTYKSIIYGMIYRVMSCGRVGSVAYQQVSAGCSVWVLSEYCSGVLSRVYSSLASQDRLWIHVNPDQDTKNKRMEKSTVLSRSIIAYTVTIATQLCSIG